MVFLSVSGVSDNRDQRVKGGKGGGSAHTTGPRVVVLLGSPFVRGQGDFKGVGAGAPSQSVCASLGGLGTARSKVILPSWVHLSIRGLSAFLKKLFILCIAIESIYFSFFSVKKN